MDYTWEELNLNQLYLSCMNLSKSKRKIKKMLTSPGVIRAALSLVQKFGLSIFHSR